LALTTTPAMSACSERLNRRGPILAWSPYKSRLAFQQRKSACAIRWLSIRLDRRESLALDTFTVLVVFCVCERKGGLSVVERQPASCTCTVLSNEARTDSPGWSGKQVMCIDQRVRRARRKRRPRQKGGWRHHFAVQMSNRRAGAVVAPSSSKNARMTSATKENGS
jgi:hypothetical protein